jgi:hypothetical protein
MLSISVEAFSSSPELMKRHIEAPPWLTEKSDEKKQREYLQGRVLIKILERFEFPKNAEFEGYLVKLTTQGQS